MQLWKRMLDLAIGNRLTLPNGTVIDKTRVINAGSARQLTKDDLGRTVLLNAAAGSTVTLPKASGSGEIIRFVVSTIATSNSHIIKVSSASEYMRGVVVQTQDTTAGSFQWWWATSAADSTGSDTITLNRTTTGSTKVGEVIILQDMARDSTGGYWHVKGNTGGTGVLATPFSATV